MINKRRMDERELDIRLTKIHYFKYALLVFQFMCNLYVFYGSIPLIYSACASAEPDCLTAMIPEVKQLN